MVVAVTVSCTSVAPLVERQRNCLFDDWAANQTLNGVEHEFAVWQSPNGKYAIRFLKSGEDSDVFVLVGQNLPDGKKTVLGYGLYGVEITWFQTSLGNIAVIDHAISAGFNELFVVMPDGHKGASWRSLYRTPEPFAATRSAISHCYWHVVKLDSDLGSLRLTASWNFSGISNAEAETIKTEGQYDVPLFYGAKPRD